MSTLADIESNYRNSTLARVRNTKVHSWKMVFLIEFLYAPFGISSFMFIPFFGQVLTAMCIILGLIYVYMTRSLVTLIAGSAGFISSTILLSLFFMELKTSALVVMYAFLALAVITSLTYLVLVSGALLRLMERKE